MKSQAALSLDTLALQERARAKKRAAMLEARKRKARGEQAKVLGLFPIGSVVVTNIKGSDPRVWSPEHAQARRHGLVGVVVHAFEDGYAVREGQDGKGPESYYQPAELRWHVPHFLYAVMLERWNHRQKVWEPGGFSYCHAESAAQAKQITGIGPGERVSMVAPAIGAKVTVDAHGRESLSL
jgi:hypothetical protein